MENCLKTQLKANVNNENLPIFGRFDVLFDEDTSNAAVGLAFTPSVDIMTNISYTEGLTVTKTENTVISVSGTNGGKLHIANKYNMTEFGLYETGQLNFDDIKYSPLEILTLGYNGFSRVTINGLTSIEDLSFIKTLNTLEFVYQSIGGNVDNLNKNSYKYIKVSFNPNITGTMRGISKCFNQNPDVLEVNVSPNISGEVEDFVAVMVAEKEVTNRTMRQFNIDGTAVTFKEVLAGSGALSWEPSGDNTKITYRNEETIITIANDGTWTRIS